MKTWGERPLEVANLFNPAFCALLIREGVLGYRTESGELMPFPLVPLLLPIVLHKRTRALLPKTIATKMHPWIQENQEVRIGFADRCAAMLPNSREAVIFGTTHNLLTFEHSRIGAPRRVLASLPWPENSEPEACIEESRFVGRWFTSAGPVTTIFAMWGVRP